MRGMDRLQRLSLLLALGGLAVIYVASTVYAPPDVSVAGIDAGMLGETVRVTGNVTRLSVSDEATFLVMEDGSGRIDVVSFDPVAVERYRTYTVEGRVEVYRGSVELILHDVVT